MRNSTTEEARRIANEKRLQKMRDGLTALEKRAEEILHRGDAMTADDRRELLRLVNVAYHTSGKIEGVFSIDSSALIGFEAAATWFDDAIFTVYPDEKTTLEAVSAGAHECNGKRCRACGYTCYTMQRRQEVVRISEVLRTNEKRRAVIMEAYRAEKARRAAV